jgi:hypothetical protein
MARLSAGTLFGSFGALLLCCDPAVAQVIYSGFNTSAGYAAGAGVALRPNTDPGWNGSTWWVSDDGSSTPSSTLGQSVPVSPPSPDGDLALHLTLGIFNETWAYRTWGRQLPGTIRIDQYVRVPAGGLLQSRPGNGGTPEGVAVHWRAESGFFRVMDGNGNGTGVFENTGFAVNPLQWYKVSTLIDQDAKTYRFFVDDQEYLAPDPLNFRGGSDPGFYIDRVDYLADSEAWLDGVTVTYTPVPEPSCAVLLLGCVAAFAGRGTHRLFRS